MQRYNPKEIEPKWQKAWDEQGTYTATLDSDREKYVAFGMFNYPSGAGIHVGHAKNFTLPDVLIRAKRQQGYEAYSPVGFDSFGLPAENYAIKTGTPPRQTTDRAIETYREQYRAMGWSQDWTKEIDTSHVDYYKWTQWCFLKLHEHGLAYQKESLQWWCTKCKTVLADEQVIAGKCWRHEAPDDPFVVKKSLNQWFFKITDLADEILEATDDLNWTPWVRTAQKNWIGRSEGAIITFDLEGLGADGHTIDVYTTAYDTIYGATFMVLAPEHPVVATYAQHAGNAQDIDEYVQKALRKSDLDREKDKTKTGLPIEGLYAVNPANGEKIPVWVADYVLVGYGTGAIMAVPGQDERDFEFANKFSLPIIYTTEQQEFVNYQDIKANPSGFKLAKSDEFDGMSFEEAKPKMLVSFEKQGFGERKVQYKLRDWLISRQRYWGAPIPVIHCEACGSVPVPEKDLPVELPDIDDYTPSGDGRSPLANAKDWLEVDCPECGKKGTRETDTMDGYVCSSWYQLRYMDPNNDTAAWDPKITNKWMPVDFYNGGDHATAHLLYARFFTRFFHNIGLLDNPEPFERMYFHAKITAPGGEAFSKTLGNGVDPLEVIESGYGADALRTYICFIAPPDVESPWSEEGVPSTYRFLNRIWTLVHEYIDAAERYEERGSAGGSQDVSKKLLIATHKAIKKASEDIESVKFNTAIAALMELTNEMYKLKEIDSFESSPWAESLEALLQLLAPFAPHMTEELWHSLGHEGSIHIDNWPEHDEAHLESDEMTIAVQINGKLRGEISVPADATQDDVLAAAKAHENVAKHLENVDTKKEIYVPGKIVNIVV